MVNKQIDIDALVAGEVSIDNYNNSGFVQIPLNKQMPHPSRYFKALFLVPVDVCAPEKKRVARNLGITEYFFTAFLEEQVNVTTSFAQKLANATGMSHDFWLRAQYHYDNTSGFPKITDSISE